MKGYLTDISTENKLFEILATGRYSGKLIHYTDEIAAISICKKDSFWLTRVDHLVDLSEGRAILPYFKSVAEDLFSNGLMEEYLYTIVKQFKETDLKSMDGFAVYTACFTTEEDSYLMWKAYAKNTEGCCIKFNTSDVDDKIIFVKVIYNDQEKYEIVKKILIEINKLKLYPKETYIELLNNTILTLRYVLKTKPFETEKEVRIIYNGHIEVEEKQKPKPHVELPFGNKHGYHLIIGPSNSHSEDYYRQNIGTHLKKISRSAIKLRKVDASETN